MDKVTRKVGRCLTETKLKNFDEVQLKFGAFVIVSQFDSQPKHTAETDAQLLNEPKLMTGYITYGVDEFGALVWIGEIIDASD